MIKHYFILFILLQTFKMNAQNLPADLKSRFMNELKSLGNQSEGILGLTVIDIKTGERYEFNQNEIFPQASAIKVPILMELHRQVEAGKLKIDQKVSISQEQVVGGSGIIKEFNHLPEFSIADLAMMMIKYSDNTATNVLIDLVGKESINTMLKENGFDKTVLQRKMMDTQASQAGRENLSTPNEAAAIMLTLYQGKFVNRSVSDSVLSVLSRTNRPRGSFASFFEESVPVMFKPGEIPGVHTEWVLVDLADRPFAIGIMEKYGNPGSPTPVIFSKIAETVYNYFWKLANGSEYGAYFK